MRGAGVKGREGAGLRFLMGTRMLLPVAPSGVRGDAPGVPPSILGPGRVPSRSGAGRSACRRAALLSVHDHLAVRMPDPGFLFGELFVVPIAIVHGWRLRRGAEVKREGFSSNRREMSPSALRPLCRSSLIPFAPGARCPTRRTYVVTRRCRLRNFLCEFRVVARLVPPALSKARRFVHLDRHSVSLLCPPACPLKSL
jgi:hypothetical protein